MMVLAVVASGCIAKDYTRPTLTGEEGTFRHSTDDTTSFATISWREYYADPNLIDLIDTALKYNADLLIAESNIKAAKEYFIQSKAAFAPSFNLNLNAGVNGVPQNDGYAAVGEFSLGANMYGAGASWELDIWGKLASAKRAQKAELEKSIAYKNLVQTNVIANVAATYCQLLAYDAQLIIYETSAQTRKQSWDVIKALKKSGMQNETAVNQAAAQYYYSLVNVSQSKINVNVTENMLSILVGKAPQKIKRGVILDPAIVDADFLKTGVPAQMLANRPDMIAAEQNLIAAHENWNYARAAMYPSLVISGNVGFSSNQFTNWFSFPGSFVSNLLGGITAPLFNQRKLKTQRNVAEQQKIQAIYQYQNTMLTAQQEVANALVTYQYSLESIENQTLQTEQLSEAVAGSLALMKNGFISYLDLLYAEDNALNSSIALVQYYLQNSQSKIQLYRSLGGGWK